MEPIRINPDEFKLENFINYYNDNVEELLSEYPNYVSRICLIDRDYMDVVIFDEDTPYELIKKIQPDVLVKGGDYKPEEVVGREFATELKLINFVDGYSTTGIIKDIRHN